MPTRFSLDNTFDDSTWWIDVYLFTNVENLKEIQGKLVKGGLELSLLTPEYIPSPLVLQFATTNALHAKATNSLKCHSVFSEMLYMLYPSTNMRQAFQTLGISTKISSLIVINYHCSSCNVKKEFIFNNIYIN